MLARGFAGFKFCNKWRPRIFCLLDVNYPGREGDHSPPASADVKKMWIYTSTPPYAFMA
jgi:hypothetical protein